MARVSQALAWAWAFGVGVHCIVMIMYAKNHTGSDIAEWEHGHSRGCACHRLEKERVKLTQV